MNRAASTMIGADPRDVAFEGGGNRAFFAGRVFRGLVAKEWRQAWRSFRVAGLWLTLAFFALLDPVATRYMPELIQLAGQGIQVSMPPPAPAMAMQDFLGDVTQVALIVAALITAPVVVGERRDGVTAWVLARPVPRSWYLGAKLAVMLPAVAAGVAASCALAWAYTWTLFGEPAPLEPALRAAGGAVALAVFVVCASFTVSTVSRSTGTAAAVSAGVLVLLFILAGLLGTAGWARWLPSALVAGIPQAAAGGGGSLAPAAGVSLLLGAVAVVAGVLAFERTEVG